MIVSHFLQRAVTPGELVDWLNAHQGFTSGGLLYWLKIVEFVKSQYSNAVFEYNSQSHAMTYRLQHVYFPPYNHWVLKNPFVPSSALDPFDGREKPLSSWKLMPDVRLFSGNPIENVGHYPVDDRYGLPRNLAQESKFVFWWMPGSPAAYIRSKIKRAPTDREVKGLAYGAWSFGAVFENHVGDRWFYERKS
jgi:hypothetical protein